MFATFTTAPQRPERKGVAFSHTYWVDHQVFLTKRGRRVPITSDEPAICATTDSTSIDQVRTALPLVRTDEKQSHSDCYEALQDDEVIAATSGEVILLGYLIRDPDDLQFSGKPFSTEPFGAGVWRDRPDSQQLLDSINRVIEETKTNGRWRELCRKWIGSLLDTPCDPPPAHVPYDGPGS